MENIIVADKKGVHIQCFTSGNKKENLICHSAFLNYGDILTITNRRKYIVNVGWFILIKINNNKEEYMLVKELDDAITNEKILDEIDFMLKLSSISYYLDQSLISKNKDEFIKYSTIRNELMSLYEQLNGKILIES